MNPKVYSLANAIAKAEGFFAAVVNGVENLPQRCHNPGNLENGDVGQGTDQGKTIYTSDQQGWQALEFQIDLMASGQSHEYKPTDTFQAIAMRWTGNDNPEAWLKIVTQALAVSPSTTLQQFMEAS